MPKVSQQYFDNKKDSILQAALNICKTKPIYEVTMKDIIRECNISQGGIYRYYSDIDEILVEVINRCNPNSDYKQKIDNIIKTSNSHKESIDRLFNFMGLYIQENMSTLGKMLFELTVLMANHPSRGRKIQSQINDGQSSEYFIKEVYRTVHEGISSGSFNPLIPENDILTFISIAIDGIAVNGVLLNSYGVPQRGEIPFNIINLFNTFKTSVSLLLNPDDDKKELLRYEEK
ncbi:MAG: TetR family transcriptional regulator [Bacillota bacterium]|nr:TetR family transcriptional regulator [Bacillota bacterium]